VWRIRFGRGFGPVVRQTTERWTFLKFSSVPYIGFNRETSSDVKCLRKQSIIVLRAKYHCVKGKVSLCYGQSVTDELRVERPSSNRSTVFSVRWEPNILKECIFYRVSQRGNYFAYTDSVRMLISWHRHDQGHNKIDASKIQVHVSLENFILYWSNGTPTSCSM
jgi:hypothetical protein